MDEPPVELSPSGSGPQVLVDPPWLNRKPYAPQVIDDLAHIEVEPRVSWILGGTPATAPLRSEPVDPISDEKLDELRSWT